MDKIYISQIGKEIVVLDENYFFLKNLVQLV